MIKNPRRVLALSCAALVAAAPVATATAAAASTPVITASDPATTASTATASARGALVRAERVAHLSGRQVGDYLRKAGFPATKDARGVDVYGVTYRTADVRGRSTTATGAVVLPRVPDQELRVVSYTHGTMATRKDAPSVQAQGDGRYFSVYFAAHGFAAVAPDYLGLGGGPGAHPYMHTATEAGASLDLLRAARTLAAGKEVTLDRRILVTGFSQGGHAAMALGAALQGDDELDVSAVAPVSGPYDLEGAELPALLEGRLDGRSAAFYLGYWLTSMDRVYDLYRDPARAFRAPYDAKVTGLFDGSRDFGAIAAALPPTPEKLVTPAYLKWLRHPSGALLRAVRENDTTCRDLDPGVPVRLFAARGDRDVAIANSRSCLKDLRGKGVDASLTDVGDVGHEGSVRRSMPRVLDWFRRETSAG
ncbi:lipase family protein [Streptosporangium sp. NPDC048047]|uniref:alpha/beta hydrolase n=1 Tax=Streptosporangium sp. NPDC048047 TaxID=3155748 RepID=UPI0034263055